ncbi:MAG: Lrp/AsnC family transcriptional regulator [Parafilimonas terrae]|nr:Lrp/AsnC family transcriptional regulator [Parafilimonas terrae]
MQRNPRLDQIDDRILRELRQDARQSNVRLAERVGLSPSACLRRVQDMEKAGIIRGYRAVIDRNTIGGGLLAFVMVGLSSHTKGSQETFERVIARAPEVIECHNVTGTIEYILRVEASDISAYKTFHTEVLGTLPQVTSITSYIVLESPKDERG